MKGSTPWQRRTTRKISPLRAKAGCQGDIQGSEECRTDSVDVTMAVLYLGWDDLNPCLGVFSEDENRPFFLRFRRLSPLFYVCSEGDERVVCVPGIFFAGLYAPKGKAICVCELASKVGGSQPNVSHPLKALKMQGFVTCEKVL